MKILIKQSLEPNVFNDAERSRTKLLLIVMSKPDYNTNLLRKRVGDVVVGTTIDLNRSLR